MASVVDRIVVPFAGDGYGEDGLSWGQLENWRAIVHLKSWLPLGGVNPLPEGSTVEDVAGELGYLMSRYQSLRTRLRFDDGDDLDPVQVVSGSGEITLTVVDAGDDAPDAVAEALRHEYADAGLDFTAEWPVRMAVVRSRGVATHAVILMSHLATDAAGGIVMMEELARRETAPVTGLAPLDQARWQSGPAGQRQNAAALRYWDGVLRSIEMERYPRPRELT